MKHYFINLINTLVIFSAPCCGVAKKSVPSPQTSQQPAQKKSYEFREDDCSTGLHEFEGDKQTNLLGQYCSALLLDELNNYCARTQREEAFQQDCKNTDVGKGNDAQERTTSAINLSQIITKAPLLKNKKVTPIRKNPIPVLAKLSTLQVTKLDLLAVNPENEEKDHITKFTTDLQDCLFSPSGPLCHEGQEIEILAQQYVLLDDKPYLFVVSSYSFIAQKIAFFMALDGDDPSLETPLSEGFYYLITDEVFALNIEEILAENVAFPFAHLKFAMITWEQMAEDLRLKSALLTSPLRKTVHLLYHLQDKTPYIPEQNLDEVSSLIRQSIENILDVIDDSVMGISTAYLFFDLTRAIFSPQEQTSLLYGFLNSKNISVAVAAHLYMLNQKLPADVDDEIIARGLRLGDPLTKFIILKTLQNNPMFYTPRLEKALIATLSEENAVLGRSTFLLLKTHKLEETSIRELAKYLKYKEDRYISVWSMVLDIVMIQASEDLKIEILLDQLEHANKAFRSELFSIIKNLELIDTRDSKGLAKYLNSKYADTILFVIECLKDIDGDYAKLFLLEEMDSPVELTRLRISKVLDSVKFANFHLPFLVNEAHSFDPNRRKKMIEYMASIKTPESIRELIKLPCKEADADNRALIFSIINAFTLPLSDQFHLEALSTNINGCIAYPEVSLMSIKLIMRIGSERAQVKLLYNISHIRKDVREIILPYLRTIDPVRSIHVQALRNALQGSYSESLETALILLLRASPGEGTSILIERLDCPNSDIQAKIITELRERTPSFQENDLLKLFEHFSGRKTLEAKDRGGIALQGRAKKAAILLLLEANQPRFIAAVLREMLGTDDNAALYIKNEFLGIYQSIVNKELLSLEISEALLYVILEADNQKPKKNEAWQKLRRDSAAEMLREIVRENNNIKVLVQNILRESLSDDELAIMRYILEI